MSALKRVKLFGQRVIYALASEWNHLDELSVFKRQQFETLSLKKNSALGAVQLIKEKKDGRIKGNICLNHLP